MLPCLTGTVVAGPAAALRTGLAGVATVSFQSWQRHAHAEELGFRDFSSLFLVKENRRQLGNSACCISFIKVSLTSRVFAMDERSESGVQCEILNLAIELNCSTKIPRKRQFARPLAV